MRYSQFYNRSRRTVAKQDSINAYLLEKAGYISQVAAGIYAFLPLGLRSIKKIEQIVREEMNAIGASELSLSALQLKSTWEAAGRWSDPNFRQILYYDAESDMALAPTHEEPISLLVKQGVQSYRDLPVLLYQFQTKFRKELRAKSGLLRGREFRMKDLYSFHADEAGFKKFYEEAAKAYLRVFERLNLVAYRTKASGGIFTPEFSDEFQVLSERGEDEVWVNHKTQTGYNREVESEIPSEEKKHLELVRSIEVGNIFPLETKYSEAFDISYLDASGERKPAIMGCYGIGISRLLGAMAELFNDEQGLALPPAAAPFDVVIIDLTSTDTALKIEKALAKTGLEVLIDDRDEAPGAKLVEADLIGYPVRLVYSAKTAQDGKVELKDRRTGKIKLVNLEDLADHVSQLVS